MSSFNKVILMGNLTRDPETTFTPSQVAICKFAVAVSRKYRTKAGEEREEVAFIDCTAFQKTAEVIQQHFHKGKSILVEGSLKQDNWEDKQTGQKRSKLYVSVDSFAFVGGGKSEGGATDAPQRMSGPAPQRGPSLPTRAPKAKVTADEVLDGVAGFTSDDVPFAYNEV